MPKNKEITISDFYCVKCGNKGIPIPRKLNSTREPGHLKKLYCLYCKDTVNHVECRDFGIRYTYEDFLTEFNYHNFDKDGNRIRSYEELKELIRNGKI